MNMDETTLKIAMAAFMHDIGKFADRQVMEVTDKYIQDHADLYFYQGGSPRYHAVFTAAFIEYQKKMLPDCLNNPEWGDGDAFINLAAGHHNPKTPMERIITIADWVSSGWDRDQFDESGPGISPKDYKKTRLFPIFEQLMAKGYDKIKDFHYHYPLKPVFPGNIFPEPIGTVGDPQKDYTALFDGFFCQSD